MNCCPCVRNRPGPVSLALMGRSLWRLDWSVVFLAPRAARVVTIVANLLLDERSLFGRPLDLHAELTAQRQRTTWDFDCHVHKVKCSAVRADTIGRVHLRMLKRESPRQMPKEIFCRSPIVHLIGQICVDFQTIELFVEGAIWLMMEPPGEKSNLLAQAITAEMSFDRKVHAFASLYRLRFQNDAEDADLRILISDLFEVQQLRNQVIHSNWNYSPQFRAFTAMKASAKAKHGLRRRLSTVTARELFEIRERMKEVAQRVGTFAMEEIQARAR